MSILEPLSDDVLLFEILPHLDPPSFENLRVCSNKCRKMIYKKVRDVTTRNVNFVSSFSFLLKVELRLSWNYHQEVDMRGLSHLKELKIRQNAPDASELKFLPKCSSLPQPALYFPSSLESLDIDEYSTLYEDRTHLTNLRKLRLRRDPSFPTESLLSTHNFPEGKLERLSIEARLLINSDDLLRFTRLEMLRLDVNRSDSTLDTPFTFSHLTELRTTESLLINPNDIARMTRLRVLHTMEWLSYHQLSRLTNLTRLKAEGHLSGVALKALPALYVLKINHNDAITEIPPLSNLSTLIICSNRTIFELPSLPSLRSLRLHSVRELASTSISQLTSLTHLSISDHCGKEKPQATLEDLTDGQLALFTNLTSLRLNENRFISDEGISRLLKLKVLDIEYNTHITGQCISRLTNLTSLRTHKRLKIAYDAKDHRFSLLTTLCS